MPADVIDYRLIGDDLQAVIVTLDPGEGVIAEAGAMMYMQDGIEMATTLDPTGAGGGLMGKLLGAGKRMLVAIFGVPNTSVDIFSAFASTDCSVPIEKPYTAHRRMKATVIPSASRGTWGGVRRDHRATRPPRSLDSRSG